MATSTAVPPQTGSQPLLKKALRLIPGIALLAAVGYAGKFLEQFGVEYSRAHHLGLPDIEYVLWAILLGLTISNTVDLSSWLRAGVGTYDFWLKAGIVLLGSRFLLSDLWHLGGINLLLVFFEIAFSLAFMTLLGRVFKLNPKLTSLLAMGSSICGVSAIMAAKNAIDVDEEDVSYAMAAILALGAVSLFAFPLIGHALHLSDRAYGLWAGLAVDNTAESTAAGALYSDVAGKMAVLAKSTRNAFIGFVVLAYAVYWSSRGQAPTVRNKAVFLWQKFPKFVLGLLFLSVLATLHVFNAAQLTSLSNLSHWAFLLAFAGVGLQTNIRELTRQGVRPLMVGLLGEIAIATITLGLVYGAERLFQI
ncbi:MAG: YeiH family protein [Acidobacteriaceae bacterium]